MKKLLLSVAFIIGAYFNTKAQSINFDGQDDFIAVSQSGSLDNLAMGNFTMEAWIYSTDNSSISSVFRKSGDYNLYLNGGVLNAEIWPNGMSNNTYASYTGSTTLATNKWYHVSFTWNNGSGVGKLYVNGVAEATSVNNTNISASEVLQIGGSASFAQYFTGDIDEVRIWGIDRTQAQIQDNMNCSLTAAQTDLLLDYTFDGGAATPNQPNPGITLVMDKSGNSNTGTLTNFALTGNTSNWTNNVTTLNAVAYATISADVTSIGVGTTVTFLAAPVNGGSAPTYQWKKNNANVGSNSDTYTDNGLVNKDTITCMITSNGNCISKDSISNKVGITVSSTLAAALNFDGNDDYVASNGNITHNNIFTYEAWININNPQDWQGIITTSTMGGENIWVQMSVNGSGALRVELSDGSGIKSYDGTTSLTGAWHHAAITFDGTNLILYVDGNPEALNINSDDALSSFTINTTLLIGSERNNNVFINGSIDEVHIWNIVRTAAQIQSDMNCSFVTGQTGLIASYNFNEGTPNANNTGITTLFDNSGNGNNGTLNNFNLTGGPTSNWTDDVNKTGVLPVVSIVGTSTLCSGQTTLLNASGANTYVWSANAASATTNTVSVTPNTTDTYTVTGANGVCTVTDTIRVTVSATPTINVTGTTNICVGSTTTLTAAGAITFTWSANAASVTTASASLNPTSTDTYTVNGTNGTCIGTTTVSVIVTATPTISITGNANICSGQTTTLTAHGASNYTWTPTNSHAAVIHIPATLTTSATFTLTGSTNGCAGIAFISTITVTPTPTVSINSTGNILCAGDNVTLNASGASTYTWSANASSATTSSVNLTPVGTDTYTVIGASGVNTSCKANQTVTVTVNALPVLSVSGLAVCVGNTTTLTATGANTYTWSTTETSPSIVSTPTAATTDYTVTGTDNNNCINATVATVTANVLPNVTVNSQAICMGNTATLNANGATTYTWSTTETTASITTTPTATTTDYTVTGTDNNNCMNMAVATVTVNSLPTVSVSSATICSGATTTLTASGTAATYTWSTAETTTSIVTPTATATMDYTVTGEDANNCTNTAIATVTVSQPTVTVASVAICAGNTPTLTATGAATYTWSTTETTASISPTPTATTTDYTVTGTDVNSCTAMAVATITVNPTPSITFNISPNTFCTTDPAAALSATPSGGAFTGTGVSGGMFDPATAGVGTYSITYTYIDGNNCSAVQDASVTVQNCGIGINQISNSNAISTYPNPTSSDLFIQTNTAFDNATVEVYSMLGQKVLTAKLQDNVTRLSLGSLNNAIYQIRVYNNTTLIYQSKIVKQQ